MGTRIQQLREELDAKTPGRAFSRAALAARLRVDPETLRRWEMGLTRPPKKGTIRARLARELGVTIVDLQLDEAVTPEPGT